jgi:hypothetical protein
MDNGLPTDLELDQLRWTTLLCCKACAERTQRYLDQTLAKVEELKAKAGAADSK